MSYVSYVSIKNIRNSMCVRNSNTKVFFKKKQMVPERVRLGVIGVITKYAVAINKCAYGIHVKNDI